MSIKLYYGARINAPIEKVIPKLCEYRVHLMPEAKKKLQEAAVNALAELAFRIAGREPLNDMVPILDKKKDINIQTEGEFWIWGFHNTLLWAKWNEITDFNHELKHDCHIELYLALFPDPEGKWTYLIPYGASDLIDSFLRLEGVENFSYWNNTEGPEEIPEEEWEQRGEMWEKLLTTGVPAKDAFTYTILSSSQVDLCLPTEQGLQEYLDKHWKTMLKRHILNRLIQKNIEEITSSQPECGPFTAYEQALSYSKKDMEDNSEAAWKLRQMYSLVPRTARDLAQYVVKYFQSEKIGITREERAKLIAKELDAFAYDYDSYDYKDRVEDRDKHIEEIEKDLLTGKIASYLQLLEEAIEEGVPRAASLHQLVRLL